MNSVGTLRLTINEGMNVGLRMALTSRIGINMTRGDGTMERTATIDGVTTTEMTKAILTIESNPKDYLMSCR